MSFSYDTPDSTTSGRFRKHLAERGLGQKLAGMPARTTSQTP